MATLRAAAILLAFLIVTLIGIPFQSLALKLDSRLRKRIPVVYHRIVCWLMGTQVKVIGVPVSGGVLMMANHSSWLDIPILS